MKKNYPLRKLDKRECRKTGIPPLHIPLSQKLDCPPKTSVLLRSRIKRIGRRNVLLLCLYPVEGQLLLSTSPDRVLFQGRHDYTTLDFSLDAKGRFRSASIYYLDDRLYDPEKYAFFLLPTGNGFFPSAGIFRNKTRSSVWTASSSTSGKRGHIGRC